MSDDPKSWKVMEKNLLDYFLRPGVLNPADPPDPAPPATPIWVKGKNASLGYMRSDVHTCMSLATGGNARTEHTFNAPPGYINSWITNGVIVARFVKREDAMDFGDLVKDKVGILNVENIGTVQLAGHPDVEPDWTQLRNDDRETLCWLVSVPLTIIYGVVTGT